MLTCPNCHHVLAARPCCSITLQCPASAPPITAVAPPAAAAPLMGSSLGAAPLRLSTASASTHQQPQQQQQQQQQQAPLATPHVSGHMFHFPTLHIPALVGCHSPCHLMCQGGVSPQCVAPCRSPAVCGGGWRWPDSGGHGPDHSLATRMHTSGGGIVDGGGLAKAGVGVGEDCVLAATRQALLRSGWYWERVSWREAEALLAGTSLGTFIVRDSADVRFLFSLSVQTERGPTSVRIQYSGGKFRLDCEAHMTQSIPEFPHVIRLVEHYIRINRKLQRHVWVDTRGQIYSPITIRQPLKRTVPTLKHLCRLAINQAFHRPAATLRLPAPLAAYIDEYPFWC